MLQYQRKNDTDPSKPGREGSHWDTHTPKTAGWDQSQEQNQAGILSLSCRYEVKEPERRVIRNSNEGQSNEKVTHVLRIFHGTPNSPNPQNAQGHCAVHFTMKYSLDAKENDEKEKALGCSVPISRLEMHTSISGQSMSSR